MAGFQDGLNGAACDRTCAPGMYLVPSKLDLPNANLDEGFFLCLRQLGLPLHAVNLGLYVGNVRSMHKPKALAKVDHAVAAPFRVFEHVVVRVSNRRCNLGLRCAAFIKESSPRSLCPQAKSAIPPYWMDYSVITAFAPENAGSPQSPSSGSRSPARHPRLS